VDFVGKRIWFFFLSAIILLPGIVFLIIAPGLKPGIDFTGGSTVMFEVTDEVTQDALRGVMTDLGHPDSVIQKMDDTTFFIRTKELSDAEKNNVIAEIQRQTSPGGVNLLAFDLVSPVVAAETVLNAFYAVLAAAVGIFLYLWWAFRNVPSPFRYGLAAIVALVHDSMIVIGVFAILGELADIEVNTMFLVAILTVIGYSVNDTIVVFDRLRENIILNPNRTLTQNANISIMESMGRSLNTSLTLLFTLLALLLVGGETIRIFLWVLIIGVIAGTYSSIGIATPLLVVWESGAVGRFFLRLIGRPQPAGTASEAA
jgi:preprotein translocase subunit SecF